MPLQFTYSERCHYNSFEPSNMSFYTYLILLDPRAGSGIFVWTKMPLLPLHPPLTYLWAPHVIFFFFFPFLPSRCRRLFAFCVAVMPLFELARRSVGSGRVACFVAAERGGAGAAVAAEQGGRERSGAAAHGASAEWRGRVEQQRRRASAEPESSRRR